MSMGVPSIPAGRVQSAKRIVVALAISTFVEWAGAGSVLPLLPLYLRKHGAPVALVGVAMSAFFFAAVFVQYPIGRLSDRVGRRPIQIGGLLTYSAAERGVRPHRDPDRGCVHPLDARGRGGRGRRRQQRHRRRGRAAAPPGPRLWSGVRRPADGPVAGADPGWRRRPRGHALAVPRGRVRIPARLLADSPRRAEGPVTRHARRRAEGRPVAQPERARRRPRLRRQRRHHRCVRGLLEPAPASEGGYGVADRFLMDVVRDPLRGDVAPWRLARRSSRSAVPGGGGDAAVGRVRRDVSVYSFDLAADRPGLVGGGNRRGCSARFGRAACPQCSCPPARARSGRRLDGPDRRDRDRGPDGRRVVRPPAVAAFRERVDRGGRAPGDARHLLARRPGSRCPPEPVLGIWRARADGSSWPRQRRTAPAPPP